MPRIALPNQPISPQLVLWKLTEEEFEGGSQWARFFPKRHTNDLPLLRQKEHVAVILATQTLLGHPHWHIRHNEEGKPSLVPSEAPGTEAPRTWASFGVSHHTSKEGITWAVVGIWENDTTGGLDLVDTQDLRIPRVAPRIMSAKECVEFVGLESWVWASKEAMFKGHGPKLDFRKDLSIHAIHELEGTIQGAVKGSPWHGGALRTDPELLLVWSRPFPD